VTTSGQPPETRHFLDDLRALNQLLVDMGHLVESRLEHAVGALASGDLLMLDEVAMADAEVNARQMLIDDRAFKLLALHQPVAKDLRMIVAIIKSNSDLERVGDLAVNIAEASRRYLATKRPHQLDTVQRMSDIAQGMLSEALESFVSGNLGIAQAVLERDDALDSLRGQAYLEFLDWMNSQPGTTTAALELMLIARHLERIGDHATNIVEDVFFIVAGEDVRHHALLGDDAPVDNA
jgi:phosphate transport system protein